ncbi:unnamed protein product [Fusarium graminearum]|nr:unnamed protein product [Fusarium graminearum]CAG1989952.1 unnamed protein product [Fusarium graminearum]
MCGHPRYFTTFYRSSESFSQTTTTENISLQTKLTRCCLQGICEQLKRLVVAYRENHPCSSYTMLWHTALIHVANVILSDTRNPVGRFFFLFFFCVQSYDKPRGSFRFAKAIGRSILSVPLQ